MTASRNRSLGPYELIAPIGAGGMGEVFRARDTRLNREVAIKVLPKEFASDPDRLRRFEQESRTLAALNHPNILTIHDAGVHEGAPYLVSELLEGKTLREELNPDGSGLPLRKAIDYALQIAQGLAAAHSKGIVHRDLKPENIFVTKDARVKILDFGLAKLQENLKSQISNSTSSVDEAPTLVESTQPGMVLGTPAYMSPEQVRGKPADHRSDIFAFGCVLYEMLTGNRAFRRDTPVQSMNAVLTEQPRELEGASTNFPPALGRVVRRCLDKDPDNRFQSAKDLTFSIELSSDGTPHSRQLSVSHGPGVLKVFLAVIGLMALAFCAGILTTRLRSPARPFTAIRYLTYSGHDHSPSTCTDGRRICFSSDRDGTSRIWVKDVGSGWENPVTSGSDDFPRFSPDGSAILFTRTVGTRKDLFRVPSIGGEPSRVVANVLYADWSPDARQVAFIRWGEKDSSSVYTVHTDGSSEALLHRFDDSRCSLPRWSPDGRRLAVTLNQSGHAQSVAVIVIGTRETKVFFAPDNYNVLSGLSWAADSQGVFFLQSESVAADTSGSTAVLFHQPLASRQYRKLLWSPVMGTVLDLLPSGNFLFDARSSRQNLKEYSIGSSNMIPRWLTLGNSTDRQPAYSPAGDEIVFSSNRSGNMEIWSVSRKPGSIPRRLTENPADDWDPAFSPDGRYVIWSSKRSGNLEVWMANADGSAPRPVTHDGFAAQNPTMTKDGRWIVYASYSPKRAGIWKIHPDGTQDTKLVPSQTVVGNAEVSPDGRYAAYRDFADEPVPVIKVLEIESGTQVPFEISVKAVKETPARLGRVRWMPNGKALAFIGQNEAGVNGVFVQDFIAGKDTTDSRRPLGPFDPENSAESFGISPDGQFITISTWEQSFNVMVTEGLDDPVFRR